MVTLKAGTPCIDRNGNTYLYYGPEESDRFLEDEEEVYPKADVDAYIAELEAKNERS